MIKGSVHAMLMLTLMPSIIPKPTAAKKARMTRKTPINVRMIRDSTGLESKRNRTENTAMIRIDTAINTPLFNVISCSILAVVPLAPESVIIVE